MSLRETRTQDSALQNGNGVPNVPRYARISSASGALPEGGEQRLVDLEDDEGFRGEMQRETAVMNGD